MPSWTPPGSRGSPPSGCSSWPPGRSSASGGRSTSPAASWSRPTPSPCASGSPARPSASSASPGAAGASEAAARGPRGPGSPSPCCSAAPPSATGRSCGLPLLAAGGALAAVYAGQRRLREGLALVGLVLMAVFAAAGVWETAYRLRLREYAGGELLTRLAPPNRAEDRLRLGGDPRPLPGDRPRAGGPADARRPRAAGPRLRPLEGLPAGPPPLALGPRGAAGERVPSSFSFGMPLTDQGMVDMAPGRWEDLDLPLWEKGFLISGAVPLRFAGQPVGDGPLLAAAAPRLRGARLAAPERGGRRAAQGGAGGRRHRGDRPAGALRPLHAGRPRRALPLGRGPAAPRRAAPLPRGPGARGAGPPRRGRRTPGPAPRREGGR